MQSGLGFDAVILMIYLTSPFLVIFTILVTLSYWRGRKGVADTSDSVIRALEVTWLMGIGLAWAAINLISIGWVPWLQPTTSQYQPT